MRSRAASRSAHGRRRSSAEFDETRTSGSGVRTTRALAFVSRIGDERARAFQRFALMKILEEVDQGHRPSRPFDLAYFCEVLEIIFRDRDTLLTLLAGDVAALDWLPEC